MEPFSTALQKFAILFSYPKEDYVQKAHELKALLTEPQQKEAEVFFDYCANTDLADIEEHFTLTFDMNPASCLEIGWHLFGEDYKRGQFLVYMRQALADRKIKESIELPDHLSHCLRLLAVLKQDEAQTYVQTYLLIPLQKIIENLNPDNPYLGLFQVLRKLLKQELNVIESQETVHSRAVSFMEK